MLVGSAWISAPVTAQTDTTSTDSGWWKGLFRPTDEAPTSSLRRNVLEPGRSRQPPSIMEDTLPPF